MLVGPYLSHPLTRYMKNARYSQKPPPLSPLTHTLFFSRNTGSAIAASRDETGDKSFRQKWPDRRLTENAVTIGLTV